MSTPSSDGEIALCQQEPRTQRSCHGSIVGPFPGAENDYRRERITGSFKDHRKSGSRRLFHRRAPKGAAPAIDWYGE